MTLLLVPSRRAAVEVGLSTLNGLAHSGSSLLLGVSLGTRLSAFQTQQRSVAPLPMMRRLLVVGFFVFGVCVPPPRLRAFGHLRDLLAHTLVEVASLTSPRAIRLAFTARRLRGVGRGAARGVPPNYRFARRVA